MQEVKVSILCLTYNHQSFIKQCIDGFLMQKCNFNFEVLIHDDASTDKTAKFIKEYQDKFPELIKPIYQLENQYSKGIKPTFIFNLPRARGKYIAFCEGDDYWTDPYKLQKQVDFLEMNSQYVLHCTNAISFDQELNIFSKPLKCNESKELQIIDFLKEDNPAITCTCLFRRPNMELLKSTRYDLGFWVELLSQHNSKAFYSSEITSVYRHHLGGLMSKIGNINSIKKIISIHNHFYIQYPKYRNEIEQTIKILNTKLLKEILKVNKLDAIGFYISKINRLNLTIRDFLYLLRIGK